MHLTKTTGRLLILPITCLGALLGGCVEPVEWSVSDGVGCGRYRLRLWI